MSFSYANAGSGPSAGGIGWFDFGSNFTITPGQTVTGLTGTLANGITVTFDLTLNFIGGSPRNFTAVVSPASLTAYFGSAGYTGIAGFPVLYSDFGSANNLSSLVLSNISVKDALGNVMPNYTVILADGESTSGDPTFQEGLSFVTNGGNWTQLAALGNTNPPTIIGSGTFIGFIGVSAPPNTAYVYTTQSPTQVVANLQEALGNTRQGIVIGFAATQIQLYKSLTGRRDVSDQFDLSISGTPSALATTAGSSTGVQSAYATIAAIPGNTYTLNETMAAGSASALTDYTQTVSAINLTTGGTIPSVGPLPETITPALGDVIQYTILNVADEIFTKTVDKAYAKPGDILTYTVSVDNPNNFAISNVNVTDMLPLGTTYIGNLIVSVPYTGTDPMSGIILTNIPANTTATVTWQVQVGSTLPTPNPIVNIADVAVPGGNSGSTNPITTQVNSANLLAPGNFLKSVMPIVASPGDIVTYTISVTNTGNVAADQVVITDPVPVGTTYVLGSLTANVAVSGSPDTTINLTNPILPGQTVALSFQVQVTGVPVPNPIRNVATIDYAYTVDPENPDSVHVTSKSSPAVTAVFQNNYTQQISDLINSIALEEAALAAIANSEGAKIQKMIAVNSVTPDELLCLNKSVSDMLDSLSMLENILKQKLNSVSCQIDGPCV